MIKSFDRRFHWPHWLFFLPFHLSFIHPQVGVSAVFQMSAKPNLLFFLFLIWFVVCTCYWSGVVFEVFSSLVFASRILLEFHFSSFVFFHIFFFFSLSLLVLCLLYLDFFYLFCHTLRITYNIFPLCLLFLRFRYIIRYIRLFVTRTSSCPTLYSFIFIIWSSLLWL